jgi:hypothetical protein
MERPREKGKGENEYQNQVRLVLRCEFIARVLGAQFARQGRNAPICQKQSYSESKCK